MDISHIAEYKSGKPIKLILQLGIFRRIFDKKKYRWKIIYAVTENLKYLRWNKF